MRRNPNRPDSGNRRSTKSQAIPRPPAAEPRTVHQAASYIRPGRRRTSVSGSARGGTTVRLGAVTVVISDLRQCAGARTADYRRFERVDNERQVEEHEAGAHQRGDPDRIRIGKAD